MPDQPAAPGTPTPEKARPREGDDKADGKPEPGFQPPGEDPQAAGNDRYPHLRENGFIRVHGENALSTFGVDVDTASYAIVRKYLTSGQMPPANAIRLEEMVNYFPYADKAPEGDDPFAVRVEMAECPWEPAHRLVRLGLKAKPVETDKRPPSNLVFLIDVSGSMDAPNRLPLVKASLKLLVDQLGEKDRVAMVVYAGASGLVLDSTPATRKETILGALDSLSAGGSTNGAGGIQQAYEVAVANFIKGGTNRVILCTDGDWNVGTTSTEALVKLIEDKRETGVFLSVFGFGMGNLRDEMLVKLAGKGNGNYGYIDTLREAHKAFVEQIGGTLITVAKDVKIQVEFNPAVIKSYRLLGYEKRALAAKDFHDDKKDAGEMGAGHVVTALYELVPTGAPDPVAGKVDPLRYQPEPPAKVEPKAIKADEAFIVKMRHKKPDGDTSTLRELPVKDVTLHYEKASEDFQFAASVASFAMLLRDSPYKGGSSYALVLELAEAAKKHDPSGYRAEFIELVRKAKTLSGKP
ncbi:MAG TPA: VWA domain-containing protein [Gemmataceae bacterium]|nr:VWA domain-containing protein [Gemmataceae bacterium]